MSEVLGSKNPVECHEAWRGAGKSSGVCEMHRAAGEHDAVPEASNRMEGLKGLKGSEFFSIESLETSIWHWNPQIAWWFETTILSIKIPKSSGWNHHLISTMNRWTEAPDRICTAPRRKGRFLGGSAAYGGALAESQGANLSFDSVHHSKINTYIHRKVYIYIYIKTQTIHRDHAHHSPFTYPQLLFIFFPISPYSSPFFLANIKDFAKKVYEDYRVRTTWSFAAGSLCFRFIISVAQAKSCTAAEAYKRFEVGAWMKKNQPYAYFTAILWIFDTVDVSWIFYGYLLIIVRTFFKMIDLSKM